MKRYRVLIADDEYYIRRRIIKIFPWESLPLELAGEAENGSQVMELMETGVDIIILDIRMPFIDGLEAARLIHRRYPHTKIIILSGYDNFAYAQAALQYGAIDYILKPVEKEMLLEVVARAVEMLEKEREQSAKLTQWDACRRRQIYLDILSGRAGEGELLSGVCQDAACGVFIGFFLPMEYLNGAEGIEARLKDRGLRFETIRETDNTILFHLFLEGGAEAERLPETMGTLVSESGLPVFGALGRVFRMDEAWQSYYQEVLEALLNRYFKVLPDWVMVGNAAAAAPLPYDIMKIRPRVVYFINTRNSQGYEDYLDSFLEEMIKAGDVGFFRQAMEEWCTTISLLGKNPGRRADYRALIAVLLEEEYLLSGVRAYLAESGSRLMEQKDSVPSDIAICRKVSAYVDEYYHDPEFNVAHVAEHFGMNISYLGSIFKRVRQLSINQYITLVRMDAAAGLLRGKKHRVSEIAGLVGYGDVFYFSRRFKSVYGVSPREYTGAAGGQE